MLHTAAGQREWRALLPLMMMMVMALLLASGCSPDAFLGVDEDRDRNFQRARDAERVRDFEGAAEYYERALDKNPRSALVHLGYASLCEVRLRRYADAVYHYQRYLRLRPNDAKSDDIRRRVTTCTEQLAMTIPVAIRSETIARDLMAAQKEVFALRPQITNLLATSAYWSNEFHRLGRAFVSGPHPVRATGLGEGVRPSVGATDLSTEPTPTTGGGSGTATRLASRGANVPASQGSAFQQRSHRVQSGDTLSRIARQHGVTLTALRRANPRVDERRLRPGTDLRIPP